MAGKEPENSKQTELEIIKILTEDIQAHRDYIQRLYRNAVWIGGVIVAAGIGLIVYTLGNQLNARIFEYRIDEALQNKVQEITKLHVDDAAQQIEAEADKAKMAAKADIEETTEQAKEDVRSAIDDYAAERVGDLVEEAVTPKLAALTDETIPDLVQRVTFPVGIVAAFDRVNGCPNGWTLFEPAISRVIIGSVAGRSNEAPTTDENGSKLTARQYRADGGEERTILEPEELAKHHHVTAQIEGDTYGYVPAPTDLTNTNLAVGHPNIKQGKFYISGSPTSSTGNSKSHNNMPPYIALYFCKKD